MSSVFVDNPVMRAELKHQQHVISTSRSGRFWIVLAVLMLAPAFITALLYTFSALTGVDLSAVLNGGVYTLSVHLVIMNVALYAVITLVTMGLAANSISREQTGKTWESLLLTTLDARQIILGKWWATLRALWGDHIMLLILRIGLLGFVAIEQTRIYYPDTPPNLLFFLIGCVIMLAFTALEEGFSAAIGLLTPLSGAGWLFFLVLFVRVAVTLGIVVLFIAANTLFASYLWGGIAASLIALALLAGATWGVLRVAEIVAVWKRAAPLKR